jgi:Tol biopolymer transport system component/DNA-binding winged helix-turn-helix (wHTH) protein
MESQSVAFGDICVDLGRQTVTRGGEPVPLEPKTFDVLRFLLDHRERLVTKDELLDAVWKDVFVTPNVLSRAVAQLRKGLGDEAHDPRYIETVARRGYRFIGHVSAAPPAEPRLEPALSIPRSRRWGGWGAGVAVIAAILVILSAGWSLRGRLGGAAGLRLPSVERLTASADVIDAVVSRDGKYLAYVRSSGGVQSLWLRQLGESNPLQLVPPAAVGFWGLSFAPDSTAIYYAVKGSSPPANPAGVLYSLPVLPGPPPRRILQGIDSAVTFSPDGSRIAFYRIEPGAAGRSALVVAHADGTDVRTLAVSRAPDRFVPAFYSAPAWSPDGARIAAALQHDDGRRASLLLVDVPSGRQTVLRGQLASAGFTAWTRDGDVLFVGKTEAWSPGTSQIWLQPVTGSEPRRLTADTAEYRNVSVSADGKMLVAVGSDRQTALWRVPVQPRGGGVRLPSMSGDGVGGMAALGDRLLFTAFDAGEPQLWTMSADGSDRRQLTDGGWSAWPCVSPDARTIYFVSRRSGRNGIWRMNADGGDPVLLTAVSYAAALRATPDGAWLYFTAPFENEDSTWRVPTGGGAAQLVVPGLGWAAISPDGRKLAGNWRATPQAPYVLATFPIDGGDPVERFTGNYFATGGGQRVQWTPDGAALLFMTTERANIWRQPLAGGEAERVTDFPEGDVFGFDVSRSGGELILARGLSMRDAYLITGFR